MSRNPFTAGESFPAAALNSVASAPAKTGVTSVSVVPGAGSYEVDVSGDRVFVDGTEASITSTTLTLNSPDADNDRVDLVVVDNTGTPQAVTGTPATEQDADGNDLPVDPAIPNDSALAATVYVEAGAAEILSADIEDGYATVVQETADTVDGYHGGYLAGDRSVEHQTSTVGGLNGSGDAIASCSFTAPAGSFFLCFGSRFVASNQSGSDGYPTIGVRVVDGSGNELWTPDTIPGAAENRWLFEVNVGETGSQETGTIVLNVPILSLDEGDTGVVELYDAGGGGGTDDALNEAKMALSALPL